jgi:drug/metabolite transporter (DMT)-like permease
MTLKHETRDWLLLAVPGIIWGASFLFIAEGLEAMGPNGVTFARLLVGFATLSLFPGAWKSVVREDWGRIALLGVLWMAFPMSLFPYAELRVSSALTGMLNGTNPLFTAIVAAVIARSLPARGVAVGIAVGIGGAVLMAIPSLGEGSSSTAGVALILAAMLSYGLALNLVRPLQHRNGALPVIWRAQAVGVVLTAPLGAPELLAAQWSVGPLLSILALGAFGTAIAMVVATVAAGTLGATRASATTFLIPPVALLLGVLVRGEQVAALAVAGGAVCLAGAWLMRRAQAAPTRVIAAAAPQPIGPPTPATPEAA